MSTQSVSPAYPVFVDVDGIPLDSGYIYIGAVNQNPETNPITAYWDYGMTVPAAQPIRTVCGYPALNGRPRRLYVASDYSITVKTKKNALVYSAPAATEAFISSMVTYMNRTLDQKLDEIRSVMDYGAKADGATDCSQAVADMYAALGRVHFPAGSFAIANPVIFQSGVSITGEGMDKTTLFVTGSHAFEWGVSGSTGIHPFHLSGMTLAPPSFTRGAQVDAVRMYGVSWFTIERNIFIALNGAAILGYACWDGVVTNNHFQSCGKLGQIPVVNALYQGAYPSNHWKVFANQFEGSYNSDFYADGNNLGEDDHRVFANKFGSYEGHNTWAAAQDVNQYHVQLYRTTGISVVDNWFFQGGAVLVKYSYAKVMGNDGRELSNGVYVDAAGYQETKVLSNNLQGNNDNTDAVYGSLTPNHFGVHTWCDNSQVNSNYVVKFNANVYDRVGSNGNRFGLNMGAADSIYPTLNGTGSTNLPYDEPSAIMTLQNGWGALAGSKAPIYSRKDNMVVLSGTASGGTITSGTTIAQLPAGYRPSATVEFPIWSNGSGYAVGLIRIWDNGEIKIDSLPVGTTQVSLNGVMFPLT